MNFNGKQRPVPITFEIWKLQLRKDCEAQGKLFFDAIGEYALSLLWEDGVDPSVRAVLGKPRRAKAA
jgi:hypothetical protein